MENCFVKNPLKLVIYDPINNQPVRTYVCLNQAVPKYVRNAATDYVNSPKQKSAKFASALKEYFGPQWRNRLGLDTSTVFDMASSGDTDNITGGDADNVTGGDADNITGGDDELDIADMSFDTMDLNDIMSEGNNSALSSESLHRTSQAGDDLVITDKDIEMGAVSEAIDDMDEVIKVRNFTSGVEIVDVDVFPEDKFSEIKHKIQIATTIPVYRSHIFYFLNSRHQTLYQIISDMQIHHADIRKLTQTSDTVLNVNIDKELYEHREELNVRAYDDFRLVGECLTNHTIYIVDIAMFIQKHKSQYQQILSDVYQVDLIYYGFVMKYWPQMTKPIFGQYINNEIELYHRYPDLATNTQTLITRYETQAKILNNNYRQYNRVLKHYSGTPDVSELIHLVKTLKLQLAITHMKIINNTKFQPINLRNLFDKFHVSNDYPEIHYYSEISGETYQMTKRRQNHTHVSQPAGVSVGAVITINVSDVRGKMEHKGDINSIKQNRYLYAIFQSDGRYMVISDWNEEDAFDFDDVRNIIIKYVNRLINTILNKMTRYIFATGDGGFPLITVQNIMYQSISVNIYWKKIITPQTFRIVRAAWANYQRAGIIDIIGAKSASEYEFVLQKGVYKFDQGRIDDITNNSNRDIIRNQYSHLSNGNIKQKWDNIFAGRKTRMYHRATDVKFEVQKIWKEEFRVFFLYLTVFLTAVCEQVKFNPLTEAKITQSKKIRKLQEYDPELFNLKKYDTDDKYSIKCQKKFQPDVFTEEEVSVMKPAQRKKLVQYHNFTTNKPAYYSCSGNARNPNLTFRVGIHPKGYCMPCCKKKLSAPGSKKAKIIDICLNKHIYVKQNHANDDEQSRYIMAYGKKLESNRISKLPNNYINELFFNSIDVEEEESLQRRHERAKINYYVVGIKQRTINTNNIGFLFCLSDAMGISIEKLVIDVCKKLALPNYERIFYVALDNKLFKYFKSNADLICSIRAITKDAVIHTDNPFNLWNELFIYLAGVLFNIFIFAFIDEIGNGDSTQLIVNNRLKNDMLYLREIQTHDERYLIILKKQTSYYPIHAIDESTYFKTFKPKCRTFIYDSKIVQTMYNMVMDSIRERRELNKMITLSLLNKFIAANNKYSIHLMYINRRDLCYAVDLAIGDAIVYMPLKYSAYVGSGIPIQLEPYNPAKVSTTPKVLTKFMCDMNAYITKISLRMLGPNRASDSNLYQMIIPATHIKYNDQYSGFMSVDKLIYYYKPTKTVPTEFNNKKMGVKNIKYDVFAVNTTILAKSEPTADNRVKLLGKSLYTNYMYQLLVMEFVNYLEKERGTKIRHKIVSEINKADFKKDMAAFHAKTGSILAGHPDDLTVFNKQLNIHIAAGKNKKLFIELFDTTNYQFDKNTLVQIKSKNRAEARKLIECVVNKIVVKKELDTANMEFPNIYIPCEYGAADFCQGKKLAVGEDLPKLLDILTDDLLNPVKEKFLIGGIFANNILDRFKFERNIGEIITIYRIIKTKPETMK